MMKSARAPKERQGHLCSWLRAALLSVRGRKAVSVYLADIE